MTRCKWFGLAVGALVVLAAMGYVNEWHKRHDDVPVIEIRKAKDWA